jgi:hypothetical protein
MVTYIGTYSTTPFNRTWSWDGQYFVFIHPALFSESRILWTRVNTVDKAIVDNLMVPLPYGISEKQQEEFFGFYSDNKNNNKILGITPYFVSPNGVIAVSASSPLNTASVYRNIASILSLVNLKTGQKYLSELPIFGGEPGSTLNVYWSLDSTALVVTTVSSNGAIISHYITSINPDFQDIKTETLSVNLDIDEILKNTLINIQGISYDGNKVLVATWNNLQLLDLSTKTTQIIASYSEYRNLETSILANNQNILYIIENTLYIYNQNTKETSIKDFKPCLFNSNNQDVLRFSIAPDGKTASIVVQQLNPSEVRLYLCDLSMLPLTIVQPPNIIVPPAQPTLVNPLPGGGGE